MGVGSFLSRIVSTKTLAGAAIGAGYGYLSSGRGHGERGAIGGGLVGGAIGALTPRGLASAAWKTAKLAKRESSSILGSIARNPTTSLYMGLGGLGAAAFISSGRYTGSSSASAMGAWAQQEGGPSTGFGLGEGSRQDRMAFQNSTAGLVQGMHVGRHG